ncbi:MAG: DUF202 domain-containing protein [Chloroflexi bacterium]|nr:DUF202 domain-containing protein [Chloroflexota bacterium]
MAQEKETGDNTTSRQERLAKPGFTSKKVTDHLANERTFLAWMRTGLATIAFGFVVERFGLLLRELNAKTPTLPESSIHYSSIIGVSLTVLGVVVIIIALLNFLQVRRAIDREQFHPSASLPILLTILASIIGLLLAIYLWFTA